MATSIASKATNTSSTKDVSVNKPTGTAEGDILVGFVTCAVAGGTVASYTTPSGWTALLQQGGGTNNSPLYVFALKAGASEPSSYSFIEDSGSGDAQNAVGAILRITGDSGFLSVAENVKSAVDGGSISGVEENALLLISSVQEQTDGDFDFSGYSVTNNNPTWTEEEDIYNEPAGIAANMGIASATYTAGGDTGVFSANGALDGMVAITESIDSTFNAEPLVLTATQPNATYTADANFTADPLIITGTLPTETHTQEASKVTNKDKNSAPNIVNKDKS